VNDRVVAIEILGSAIPIRVGTCNFLTGSDVHYLYLINTR
jgi:hypothetical protein